MSSSSCMHSCVPSAALLKNMCHKPSTEVTVPTKHCHVHCPSPILSWGHHRAKAERITSCSCPTLQQVRSPSYLPECLSCDHLWAQNATLLLPQANTRLLLLWAAPKLCPQGTLCCCLILFCKRASANFHSVRTSKFYVCNSWLLKRK